MGHPGACHLPKSSKRQIKQCRRDFGLAKVLSVAKEQAITACEETFQYDRWNCTLKFNRKTNRTIFGKIYRETAFVYSLMAASITHAVARACASGDMMTCSCMSTFGKSSSWKGSGCGDDFKYGKRFTKNFLDYKHAGNDQVGEILRQDLTVGIDAIGEQLREVCKCHGFSGSCTTKTCWKRLGPFNSAMGLLKKHYHHAVKKKLNKNNTMKRDIKQKKIKVDRKDVLVYFQKTPNLCARTKGRICKDRNNCATLCCTRGYVTGVRNVTSRCRCRMVNCCFVECDTCVEEVDFFTCK